MKSTLLKQKTKAVNLLSAVSKSKVEHEQTVRTLAYSTDASH